MTFGSCHPLQPPGSRDLDEAHGNASKGGGKGDQDYKPSRTISGKMLLGGTPLLLGGKPRHSWNHTGTGGSKCPTASTDAGRARRPSRQSLSNDSGQALYAAARVMARAVTWATPIRRSEPALSVGQRIRSTKVDAISIRSTRRRALRGNSTMPKPRKVEGRQGSQSLNHGQTL